MIINKNIITLQDSGLELNNSLIIANAFSGDNKHVDHSTVTLQINFYANGDRFLNNVGNALNVEGFDRKKRRLTFDYPVTDTNVFLFFDIKIKEYLMSLYPSWDIDKLIVTTESKEEVE